MSAVAGSQNAEAYMAFARSWNAAHTSRGCSQAPPAVTACSTVSPPSRSTGLHIRHYWTSNVRFGGKADIVERVLDVCF
jgi:hypothetical protein